MKDAGGRALDPGLSIGQLAQTDKGAGNIVLTPSRKPTEHEKEKQQIEHHLNSLPDPHYDKPGGEFYESTDAFAADNSV